MPLFLHLVRHGEVENPRALSYGRLPGFPLSDLGRGQASVTADYLKAFGGSVEVLLTSPLERACETAGIICDALGSASPEIDDRLIEAGSWRDGLPRTLSPVLYARRYFNHAERRKSESPISVATRMRDVVSHALARLPDRDRAAAVLVSHQTPIWWARVAFDRGLEAFHSAALRDVTPWIYVRGPCDLASVTTLVFEARHEKPGFRYFAP